MQSAMVPVFAPLSQVPQLREWHQYSTKRTQKYIKHSLSFWLNFLPVALLIMCQRQLFKSKIQRREREIEQAELVNGIVKPHGGEQLGSAAWIAPSTETHSPSRHQKYHPSVSPMKDFDNKASFFFCENSFATFETGRNRQQCGVLSHVEHKISTRRARQLLLDAHSLEMRVWI